MKLFSFLKLRIFITAGLALTLCHAPYAESTTFAIQSLSTIGAAAAVSTSTATYAAAVNESGDTAYAYVEAGSLAIKVVVAGVAVADPGIASTASEQPGVGIDATGNIYVAAIDNAGDIVSYKYDSATSAWTDIGTSLSTMGSSASLKLTANNVGQVALIYNDFATASTQLAYLDAGDATFTTITRPVPGSSAPTVSLSSTGFASYAYNDTGTGLYATSVNIASGTTVEKLVASAATIADYGVGTTAAGDLVAAYSDFITNSVNVVSYAPATDTLSAPLSVASISGTIGVVRVATDELTGNSLILFSDNNTVAAAVYNKAANSVSAPITLSTSATTILQGSGSPVLAIDAFGNALAGWTENNGGTLEVRLVGFNSIRSGTLTSSGIEDLGIVSQANFIAPVIGSTSSVSGGNKTTFASIWSPVGGGDLAGVSVIDSALPSPANARGKQVKNKFLTQTDLVNVLRWTNPSGIAPASWKIYRDSALTVLAGTVPGNKLKFEDHNRKKGVTYTYYIVGADASGAVSSPVSVTVTPKR